MRNTFVAAFGAFLLIVGGTGCGGGSGGGNDSTEPDPQNNQDIFHSKNIVPYNDTCNTPDSRLFPVQRTMKVGHDGAIDYGCSAFTGMSAYYSGNPLAVTDLNKSETITGTIDGEPVLASVVYHYGSGLKEIRAELGEGKSYDCRERYPSPLPLVISGNDEADDLLEGIDPLTREEYFENVSNRIASTCPEAYYTDLADVKAVTKLTKPFDIVWKTNYVITDAGGNIHRIATEDHYRYKVRVSIEN